MGAFSRIVAFYSEPPRFEINNGIVNIQLRSGQDTIEMAMSYCTFAKSVERAKRAVKHYSEGAPRVIIDD